MRIVLSIGLKGGVGKTTIAIGVARALIRKGLHIGILDLDYRTPNVPIALDGGLTRLDHRYEGDILVPPSIEGIRVMSMAYIWPEHKCVMVEDSDAMEDVLHLLKPGIIDWGELDYLVVDTPPTSVGVVKVALEAEDMYGAVIVSHASTVSRMDTMRTIDLFAEKEVPIIGIVCNQSVDEDGNPRYDLLPSDIERIAGEYGIPYLVTIPHIRNMERLSPYFDVIAEAVTSDRRATLKIKAPEEEAWKRLLQLTMRLRGSSGS